MKKSHIYTRTGDLGSTSLIGGSRAKKHDLQLEAYGTIDELNAHMGLLIALLGDTADPHPLRWIQSRLFDVGTHLAMPRTEGNLVPCPITEAHVSHLETLIDTADAQLAPLRSFVLPGGSVAAAECHVCRTVCRRAERLITAMGETLPVSPSALAFMNRLSDFLFVYARLINKKEGVDEKYWASDSD